MNTPSLLGRTGICGVLTAAGLLAAPVASLAQAPSALDAAVATPTPDTTATTTTPAAVPAATNQLAEVVVTAQRRSENLQKVSISVTAVSAARLNAANITSTADLAGITPSLTFSDSNGNSEPRIRGIGNSSAGPSVEDSVATYVDGVYISSAAGALQHLENIQRVEVLDGPQGTLFGRNATGGLVQIITKDPKSTFSGNADISYENYDTTRLGGYVTGPILNNVAADLAVYASHQGDGYGTDLLNNKPTYKTDRDISARSKWLARFGPDTTLRVAFDFSNLSSSDPGLSIVPGLEPTYAPFPAAVETALANNRYDNDSNNASVHRLIAGGVSARLDQVVGPVTLTDIVAYRRTHFGLSFDGDGLPLQIVQQSFNQEDEQVTEEFQIAPTHSGKLQWIAGVFYFNLDSGYSPFETFVQAPPKQTVSINYPFFTTQSVAPYAQATYEVLPQTHLTGGFRYTFEDRTESGSAGSISAAGVEKLAPLTAPSISTETPTWRLALDHQFGPDTLAYISWNRGFKSGGFNPTTLTQAPYKPERLDDYEIGEKSTLFNGKARVNAAFFYYIYKDIQVNTFVNSLAVIYNGAAAREYGLDANFDYSVTPDLLLTGGVVAMHDRFTSFPNAVVTVVKANRTVSTVLGSATGNRLPFAPDATLSLGVDYKHDIANGRADLFVNDLYDTGYFGQADNYLHQGAFHQLNASLQYVPNASPLSFKLYARNIANTRVADFLVVSTTGAADSFEPPATYGFMVGVKF